MFLILLWLSLYDWTSNPQIPNYFRTYIAAKTESGKSGKDMLIFFSEGSCPTCEGAWVAFTKDEAGVKKYISTRVEADQFDGKILWDHFQPGHVPAWIVLNSQGEVKEKWEGGWKDATGKGTLYINDTPSTTESKQRANVIVQSNGPDKETVNVKNVPQSQTLPPTTNMPIQQNKPKEISNPTSSTNTQLPYFLQAGYFGSPANADKCLAELKTKGQNQFTITNVSQQGKTFYSVRSVGFATEQEAQQQSQKLAASGISTTVKKNL
ncbi:MAG TPA: SPOR domain-containing protein, partial [Saprospiraceae bacterium]|nr:SPOR domain-containing protein [Saprospiraceae bacterium]